MWTFSTSVRLIHSVRSFRLPSVSATPSRGGRFRSLPQKGALVACQEARLSTSQCVHPLHDTTLQRQQAPVQVFQKSIYPHGAPVIQTHNSIANQFHPEKDSETVPKPSAKLFDDTSRTSVLLELTDGVGVLHDVLRYFWKHNVNICRIESRPVGHSRRSERGGMESQRRYFDFFVDFEGSSNDANVRHLLDDLHALTDQLLLLDAKSVQWFPRHISELDRIAYRTLDAGVDLQADDHPGFHDPVYRARRGTLARLSAQHQWDHPVAHVEYTTEETSVWTAVWDQMEPLWERYACKEYLATLKDMTEHCGYSRDRIPQQQNVSEYLLRKSRFRMRPVPGLLSSRDFLNGLAFRVFFCTQYMRHHSQPLYTPEPDLCHELLGHAPMLADPDFADFSQEIGLASLGASDEEVSKLAHCYWHSVEFGLCREKGRSKAYGAGLLSSFGELAYACNDDSTDSMRPHVLPWDPEIAAKQEFPITTYQPVYFLAESLQDAKHKMRQYCEDLPRPFFATYNPQTNSVHIDRPVKRNKGIPE